MKNTKINNETQSLQELWESINSLSAHVVQDNEKCDNDEYPKRIRTYQLKAIEELVNTIKETHSVIEESNND